MYLRNLNRIVIAHLNLHSLRNKLDLLTEQVIANVDALVISETKFDSSFQNDQFRIPGFYTPFRRDSDQFGRGIMVFIREDIPSKFMSLEAAPIESLYIERNFCKKKWLLNCSYNPNRNKISNRLNTLRKS